MLVHRSQAFVLLCLAMAPASGAAAAGVTPASGASRTCTGETRVRVVSSLLEPTAVGQEQASPMSEALSVRRTGDSYEIRRTNSMPERGPMLLIAHIRPDGTVIDAILSGGAPSMDASALQRLSMLAARTLPERLMLGREFRSGDNLYADIETQDVVASMMGQCPCRPGFSFRYPVPCRLPA